MPGDNTATITDEFERYCSVLKSELSYVEDGSFSWDDAVGLLIIQLKNTDSLNKARRESHATQIQLTSEREAGTKLTSISDLPMDASRMANRYGRIDPHVRPTCRRVVIGQRAW